MMLRALSLSIVLLASINTPATELSQEPPQLQTLLRQASQMERNNPWKAASLYCQGARNGSTEAQYRLAMLFAFGQGVPEDRAIAASLLAVAAQQGHQQAVNMLETIRYSADKMPDCVLSNVAPPRGKTPAITFTAGTIQGTSLNQILAALPKNRRWLIDMIAKIAHWHEVDPKLALAIVSVESAFQTTARSSANAMGLMQLIPATAERFNVKDAFDASENVKGGVRYLRWLLDRYHGEIELVAAAYNAGEGAVDKYKGVPPYRETRDYVVKVLQRYPYKKHGLI